MRANVKFYKLLSLSSIQSQSYTAKLLHFRKFSHQIKHSDKHANFTQHNRQTQRKYLGKLLLSPPQQITNPYFYCKTIHSQIILSGFESNTFLNNILLTFYSKCDDLKSAVFLFDKMPERNLISWSSMISGYCRNGYIEEALFLFGDFLRNCDENPNEFVLATVIQCCAKLASLEIGMQLHGFVIKAGYNLNVHVGTSLIDFFAKSRDLDAASLVFDELEEKSVVTWTAIIMGFGLNGRSDVSVALFKEMLCTCVVPDKHAFSSVLSACSVLEFLEGGKQVHAHTLRIGAIKDISVSNALIDFYAKCGELKTGRNIFNCMLVRNCFSWAVMISGYMQNGLHWEALNLFRDMNIKQWKGDQFSCTSILASCGSLGALDQGKQVHTYTLKLNFDNDEFVTNSLIDMYCKCNLFNYARKLFLAAAKLCPIRYNTMIEGYARNGSLYETLDIFSEMRRNLISPTPLTFISLLGVSTSHISIKLSRQLHSLMIKCSFCLESFGGSALIDTYSKFSFVGDARLVFDEIEYKDIVVWNSMLFGYATQSENERAFRLYLDFLRNGERPNGSTIVAVIMASSNLASLFHGLQFHNQAIKLGLESAPFVANALIDMYAKCGNINASETLFRFIAHKDIAIWNSMLSVHAHNENANKALQMFEQMQAKGIKPDNITFVSVLSACANLGLVEKGFCYFASMSEFGFEPETEHYACMVSLLGRAGKLHEAKLFIDKMPIQPNVIVWNSLLSACRITGNVKLGQIASEMAISSDPRSSGSYVLLSNIFASKNMWSDVKKLRGVMEKNGVVKETGYSWIEINGEVHFFVARDKTHEQIGLIYFLIDHLIQHMENVNYEPSYAESASV